MMFVPISSPCSCWPPPLRAAAAAVGNVSKLHAAGRLCAGNVGETGNSDRDRRRRDADRTDRWRWIWLTLRDLLQLVPAIGDLWNSFSDWCSSFGHLHAERRCRHDHSAMGAISSAALRPRRATTIPNRRRRARRCSLRSGRGSRHAKADAAARLHSTSATSEVLWRAYAVGGVSLALPEGRVHAIIGPNGAGRGTSCVYWRARKIPTPTSLLHGIDVTAADVTAAYRRGMAKSYQMDQLFPGPPCARISGFGAGPASGAAAA